MCKRFIFILSIPFLLFGCVVSKNKYDDMTAKKVAAEAELQALKDQLEDTKNKKEDLEKQFSEIIADTTKTYPELRRTRNELDELQADYDELQAYYDDLVNKRTRLSEDLAAQQEELVEARKALEIEKARNQELLAEIEERAAKVAELEKILSDKEAAVASLRKKVSDALLNFQGEDLQVEVKNGKVYVSLAEQLLFPSGSRAVNPQGKEALKKLSEVLRQNPDINVMVEGHTDDVPITGNNKYLQDNWDLSVLRATSIVNILTENGVDPKRVIASGKGEHAPVDTNQTKEGRSKNRRTEVILTPKLDELFQILEAN